MHLVDSWVERQFISDFSEGLSTKRHNGKRNSSIGILHLS